MAASASRVRSSSAVLMLVSCRHQVRSVRPTPALAGFDTGAGAVDSLMTASGSGLVVAGGTRSVSRSVIGSARRRVAREEAAQVAGELGPLAGQQQHTDPDQQQTPGPDDE